IFCDLVGSCGSYLKKNKSFPVNLCLRCEFHSDDWPFNVSERKVNSYSVVECDHGRKEVIVRTGGMADKTSRKTYTFDMVFGAQAKQIDVYRTVVCPILDEVLMGYNCTVFAYGQTGTGKTFTMEGERSPNEEYTWEEDPLAGVIPRTLHQIFEKLAENGTEFSVKVSLLEIYNEELFDLLSPTPDVGERLQLFDDPRNKRGVIIKGLEEMTVHNKDEVYQILERGAAKRTTAATYMNQYSSRSHSVFSITLHMKETTDGEELVKIGKLNLVDLAGSENIGRSGAVDKRAREAGNINQSLLTLGRVITALVERTPHIPYRESKLTRILQDSLGGRTKTCIIATVSPASINLEETLSTLEYAHRAKNIMNKPEVNQKLTKRALIKEYTEEIERLKRDLTAAREKNGVYISLENYDALRGKMTIQEEQIADYTEKITAMEEELKKVTELFTVQKNEMEKCQADLQAREMELEVTQKDLEITKVLLAEEEYVASSLENSEEKLHGTATKVRPYNILILFFTNRLKAVEQHNVEAQKTFMGHMNIFFDKIQNSVRKNYQNQQEMLNSYSSSVNDLLSTSFSAFEVTTAAIDAAFTSVKEMVSTEVSLVAEKMLNQDTLTSRNKNHLMEMIEEHARGLDKALSSLTPVVQLVQSINSQLQEHFKNNSSLAEMITGYKEEMATFFHDHCLALSKLHKDSSQMFSQLRNSYESLQEQVELTKMAQKTGTAQLITLLQNQLTMLDHQAQQNFSQILEQGCNLRNNINDIQENIIVQNIGLVNSTTSQQNKMIPALDDLSQVIKQSSHDNVKILLESDNHCKNLASSLRNTCQEATSWAETATAEIGCVVDQQRIHSWRGERERLLASCKESGKSTKATEHMRRQKEVEDVALKRLLDRLQDDQEVLTKQKDLLLEEAEDGLTQINGFLTEELKTDLPTGNTPQRKDYCYPVTVVKTEPRDLLLEKLRQKQMELTATLKTTEDSLDEEIRETNESLCSEKSYLETINKSNSNASSLTLQHKRSVKKDKENKAAFFLEKAKEEDSRTPSLPKSKYPLRALN
uniref:Kinesin family member 11 n=1 Tax=Naja naja TaxID=35670 RepID=A0A8C6YFX4_NAJNA